MARGRIPNKNELNTITEYIRYESKTGKLFWKKHSSPKGLKDKQITRTNATGYYQTVLKGKAYFVHRIVWFFHYGTWPILDIDHINGNTVDNRINNLREVTLSQNMQNRIEHRGGLPIGVSWHIRDKKWYATAPCNFLNRKANKQKYIGSFLNIEEAANAVIKFCKKEDV